MSLTSKNKGQNNVVYAECAGISELKGEERTTVEKLVERILNSAQFAPGLTDLTEHHIRVISKVMYSPPSPTIALSNG